MTQTFVSDEKSKRMFIPSKLGGAVLICRTLSSLWDLSVEGELHFFFHKKKRLSDSISGSAFNLMSVALIEKREALIPFEPVSKIDFEFISSFSHWSSFIFFSPWSKVSDSSVALHFPSKKGIMPKDSNTRINESISVSVHSYKALDVRTEAHKCFVGLP